MRTAEDVLQVIRDRGQRGLPVEDVYRQLYKPSLYLRAYGRIYRNDGAMTQGTTKETVDGMSLEKIEKIIEAVRFERYRWTPVRRVEIPKAHQPGKTRPLGIPTWPDKLLQEVMRSLLEAYYEPQFSDHSHGFRPERGCHTALATLVRTWAGTRWFIEGDIKGCFDNIDHETLLSILAERIHDNRFLRLTRLLLQAGYLEQWRYHPTFSGTPQGGIISPILSNIYLDRLDKYVEETLIPEYTRGNRRRTNPEYNALQYQAATLWRAGKTQEANAVKKQYQRLPSTDPQDPDYRRLRYIRYADDFLLGFAGPKAEAEEIKEKLKTFLRDQLKLELSEEKTLITHAATNAAMFLGYEVATYHRDARHDHTGRRGINGRIELRIPARVIEERCAQYMQHGKPIHRAWLMREDDFTIIAHHQQEYRGYVQYYLLAQNVAWLNKLRWVMEVSLLKTLAAKHHASVKQLRQKYQATLETEDGPRSCLKVIREREGKRPLVAYFGGLPLRRKPTAVLQDHTTFRFIPGRTELIQRLLAQVCEVCEATEHLEVHHIRKLADLKTEGRREKPPWVVLMATRRRKTLVLCKPCHDALHAGTLQIRPTTVSITGEPDEAKVSRPVRRGADGEGLGNQYLAGSLPD
jgi:group II intron reverse transcriptase/maturase